jgi:hypothetical protein
MKILEEERKFQLGLNGKVMERRGNSPRKGKETPDGPAEGMWESGEKRNLFH